MKKGLLLFVDDERFVLSTLRVIFRREFSEYHLELAQRGDEALEILASYDEADLKKLVVCSDWLMPGKRGDELLIEIHQKYPQSKNFLLSGMINMAPDPDAFKKGGIVQVVPKPWNNDELVALLKRTLESA